MLDVVVVVVPPGSSLTRAARASGLKPRSERAIRREIV